MSLAKAYDRPQVIAHANTGKTLFQVRIEQRLIFPIQSAIKKIAD
jgi:hypothetical protein